MNKVLKIVLIFLVLLALIPIVVVFAVKPVMMAGNSMIPNYKNGEYLLINKLSYKLSKPQRGDVVLFLAPPDLKTEFIKRVIGLPGEKIRIENGFVFINNNQLNEPYLSSVSTKEGTFGNKDVLIPGNQYALFGDNRPYSLDSRYFGFVPQGTITGKVSLCYSNCN